MSTVEIIEEYRALWAQAQQEAQFAQALAGAIMHLSSTIDGAAGEPWIIEPRVFQDVTENYRMRVDQDGDNIIVALEAIENE